MKVLVAEPDLSSQETLRWAFYHEAGVELVFVQTAFAAVVQLLQSSFDLAVFDAQIAQEQSGFLPQYCQNSESKIPVLFTLTDQQLQQPSTQVLVSQGDYIFKPFSSQDLLYRVKRLCKSSPTSVILCTPHEDLSQQVQWALAASGIIVWTHANPSTIFELITSKSAKAVLWDIQSLDVQAMGLIEAVRARCPVVMLAPLTGLSAEQAQVAMQVDDYVCLPFTPIDLETRLKKQIHNRMIQDPTAMPQAHVPSAKENELEHLKVTLHHEIRNPLTSILIGAQALAHQFDEGSPEKNVLTTIEKSSQRIKGLMDSLASNQTFEVAEYVGGVQMLKLPW